VTRSSARSISSESEQERLEGRTGTSFQSPLQATLAEALRTPRPGVGRTREDRRNPASTNGDDVNLQECRRPQAFQLFDQLADLVHDRLGVA